MTGPSPFPKRSDTLKLKAKIRPVTRINRKVLMAGAAIGVLGIFAAISVAFAPPRGLEAADHRELFNTVTKRTPDGLTELPASYANWNPDIPRLGAPLTGDLGATMVAEEREWGLQPDWQVPPDPDFRPSQEEEAARARKLAEAKLADQASKAGVFFDLTTADRCTSSNHPTGRVRNSTPSCWRLPRARRAPARPGLNANANFQDRKIAFSDSRADDDIYNPHGIEMPASPFQLMAGSLISASLVTGINSDLPGTVIAQVTQPVYDSISGTHLLIPQGSRLIGRYQSEISFGQSRALLVWDRILFPDGRSIRISEPGTDESGAAGLSDRTDNHWDRVLAAAGLATITRDGCGIRKG
jgi:type IV secretory pathway VirB10-like protein